MLAVPHRITSNMVHFREMSEKLPFGKKEDLEEVETVHATKADIAGIIAVEEDHMLAPQVERGTPEEVLRDRGFLVHKLEPGDLGKFLGRPDSAIAVCKHNGEIIGYAVGYTLKHQLESSPNWTNTVQFVDTTTRDRLEPEHVWYYRQEAIKRAWQGRGISKKLSAAMRKAAIDHGCTSIFGEILEEPYRNDASFRALSGGAQIIGRVQETYEGVHYVWALVESPLARRDTGRQGPNLLTRP